MGGEEQSLATGGVHGRRRLGGRAFELCFVDPSNFGRLKIWWFCQPFCLLVLSRHSEQLKSIN